MIYTRVLHTASPIVLSMMGRRGRRQTSYSRLRCGKISLNYHSRKLNLFRPLGGDQSCVTRWFWWGRVSPRQ